MPEQQTLNVSKVVDNMSVRGITYLVLGLCFLAMISDGYNLGVVGLAAPGIVKQFGVSRAVIAPVFSAALFGMLIGALGSGFWGDAYGRKRGILLNVTLICVFSFACGYAQNVSQLLWLRFMVGLGLGGLLPNVTALMAEFVPRKVRGTFTTYAFLGITTGGVLPGIVSSLFVKNDWSALFFIGGIAPLLVLPALYFFLPESLKFLALQPARSEELRASLKRLSPELELAPETHFVLDETAGATNVALLFGGRLRWITPVLWMVYACIMLVNFFINSWLALVLGDIGFTPSQAAGTTSLYYVGGICGGLIMGLALDNLGPVTLAVYTALGCAVMVTIGTLHHAAGATYLLVGMVGFSVLGSQVGMSAIAGLLYPTAMRSKGAGFAHCIGRLGAIVGPLLAGALLERHAGFLTLFLVPVLPLALASLCFLVITWVWTGRPTGRPLSSMQQLQSLDP